MSVYQETKPLSLIEQKKLQWAKEKEELAKLSIPWGKSYSNIEKANLRTKELSKFSKSQLSLAKETSFINNNLPPINKGNKIYETEGDTSGYATDSINNATPENYEQFHKKPSYELWTNWNKTSESESSSSRGERPKWRDREFGGKQLPEPHPLDDNYIKKVEPPGWMQRGLKSNKEVLVICHSPEQYGEYLERPRSNEDVHSYANITRTHLRGQNIPLEPIEIVERDLKRQKALELQKAIKQQLEERETKRKQERERKIREEIEEELRISRDKEIERLRIEKEQRLIEEKREREQKRNKAMHEALENAEKQAKFEKHKHKYIIKTNSEESPKLEQTKTNLEENGSPQLKSPKKNSVDCDRNIFLFEKEDELPQVKPTANLEIENDSSNVNEAFINNYNLVLPNSIDSYHGVQLALLVPAINISNTLPISLPITIKNNENNLTENRILTPSLYRIKKNSRESSTQTDPSYFSSRENQKPNKHGSLERRQNSDKKDGQFKYDERNKDGRSEKPKWGVNRPPTRYVKQSEKDPLYQKRKLRQKIRELRIYEDKNNNYSESSDDSVSNTSANSTSGMHTNSRSLWHKNERLFSQNISVYQTEIVPLEVDEQGRIYVADRNDYQQFSIGQKYKEFSPDLTRVRFMTSKDLCEDRQREKKKQVSDSDTTDSEDMLEKLKTLRQRLLLKKVDDNSISRKVDTELPQENL